MTEPEPPFNRTVCACDKCVECCRQQPGFLIPRDIVRIQEYLGENVADYLCASPGAVVIDTQTGRGFSVRTITPRTNKAGCVFLTPEGKCSIHEVSPFGCAYADTHQSRAQGQRLSHWAHHQILNSQAYQNFRSKLPLATRYKPRRAA